MKWEITTIIPLVGRFCPSDTMRIWKKGGKIRADFHLVGIEKLSWQKGDRSIMFTFNDDPNQAAGKKSDWPKKFTLNFCILAALYVKF